MGPAPAWARIEAGLLARIGAGELRPGQRLPPERALASSFGVSRMTVRQALGALADRGLLERGVGRGTFVAGSPVIEARERQAPADVAAALGVPDGARVFRIRRVRSVGGRVLAVEDSWLPLP